MPFCQIQYVGAPGFKSQGTCARAWKKISSAGLDFGYFPRSASSLEILLFSDGAGGCSSCGLQFSVFSGNNRPSFAGDAIVCRVSAKSL